MAEPLLTARPRCCSSHMYIKQLSQIVTDSNSNRTVVIIRNTSILVTQTSARKMNSHDQKLSLYQHYGRAMVQAAFHVPSQTKPCGICGEQGRIETGFAPSTSIAQHLSISSTSYPHSKTLVNLSVVKLHTHLFLYPGFSTHRV
jgi:hypothetical protein